MGQPIDLGQATTDKECDAAEEQEWCAASGANAYRRDERDDRREYGGSPIREDAKTIRERLRARVPLGDELQRRNDPSRARQDQRRASAPPRQHTNERERRASEETSDEGPWCDPIVVTVLAFDDGHVSIDGDRDCPGAAIAHRATEVVGSMIVPLVGVMRRDASPPRRRVRIETTRDVARAIDRPIDVASGRLVVDVDAEGRELQIWLVAVTLNDDGVR